MNTGIIVQVSGPVVDVRFEPGKLPGIREVLLVDVENRQRVMRFLENMCLGAAAVGYRTESMHGAGSPQAQRIMIARQGDIQGKKQYAKDIAGIQ